MNFWQFADAHMGGIVICVSIICLTIVAVVDAIFSGDYRKCEGKKNAHP